jgi:hypothetical protein
VIKLIETKKTTWGGRRTGAGRPVGTKKDITRKTRSIAAFDDEWEMIRQFSKIVKKDKDTAKKILDGYYNEEK